MQTILCYRVQCIPIFSWGLQHSQRTLHIAFQLILQKKGCCTQHACRMCYMHSTNVYACGHTTHHVQYHTKTILAFNFSCHSSILHICQAAEEVLLLRMRSLYTKEAVWAFQGGLHVEWLWGKPHLGIHTSCKVLLDNKKSINKK